MLFSPVQALQWRMVREGEVLECTTLLCVARVLLLAIIIQCCIGRVMRAFSKGCFHGDSSHS